MNRISLTALVFAAAMLAALPLSAQEEASKKAKKAEKTVKAVKTEIEVVDIEPFAYAAVEMTGSYEQHAQAFMTLYSAAGQQGLAMTEAPFGIYHNSPEDTPEEELKWEIGMPVPADTKLAEPIVLKKWEFTKVAQLDFEGAIDSDEMKAVYYGMYEWIETSGYELAGPMMERFLSMPAENDKGEMVGKVQIVFPVKKKLASPSGVKLD
jgi:AraC family transcriptional regulator